MIKGIADYPQVSYERTRTRAMNQLKNIVGTSGLRQDIKRVRKAESLRGATKWAQKHSTEKTQYTAKEEDIDGDGIQDVLVKTQNGDLVIVNGYTVRKSDYPYRRMFGELPKATRKEHGNYKNYLKTIYGPTYDERTGVITGWKQDPKEHEQYTRMKNAGFTTYAPKNLNAYQLFCSQMVAAAMRMLIDGEPWKYMYVATDDNGEMVPKLPPITFEINADTWNYAVVKPIIELMMKKPIPDDIDVHTLKELCARPDIAKFKKSREFKERSMALVRQYIAVDDEVQELTESMVSRIESNMIDLAARWIEDNHQTPWPKKE